nr:zinc finger, CCHC-type, retrotransposon Gag domain protein [Tanacetum cinerariifolium]
QFFPRAEQERLKREYHSIRQMDTETSTKFMQRFLRLAIRDVWMKKIPLMHNIFSLRRRLVFLDGRRWNLNGIFSEIQVRESLLYTFIHLRINGLGRSGNGRSINNKTTASGDGFEFTLRVSNDVARERSRP